MKLVLRLIPAVCWLGVLATGDAWAEHAIDLRGGIGYDSNAFDLSQQLGERSGFFTELEATVSAEGRAANGWIKKADIGVEGRLFESGLRDADRGQIYVRAQGESDERYDQNGWAWSLRSRMRDRTFVSRLTGVEAVAATGEPIGDRFDSLAGDLDAEWRLPGLKIGRLSLGGSYTYRNYLYDYDQLGLARLDYQQYGLMPEYRLEHGAHDLRIRLKAEQRDYRDRRISDATGNPVPGTDLEYRYYSVDARYQLRMSRRVSLELNGGYDIREDNGVGYGDRTEWNAGVEWTLRLPGRSRLMLESEYSSRVFDRQTVGDPTVNDEVPEKKGFNVRLRYTRPFPFVDVRGLSLVAEAEWESYDNSRDDRFAYDRTVGFIGVRQDF